MSEYIEREAALSAQNKSMNLSECRKRLESIPAADMRPVKWIPVTERLPRDRQFVLVYCGDNKRIRPSDRFDVAILLGDSIFTSLGVTHWMPLPEPPKEG